MSPLQAALEYFRGGFTPIPESDRKDSDGKRQRKPTMVGWMDFRPKEEQDIIDRFNSPLVNGVGLRLGPQFGALCDVDLDCHEATQLAHMFLPKTAVFGRPSNLSSHYVFRVPDTEKAFHKNYCDADGAVLLEIRFGDGAEKTTFPASINDGEQVAWEGGGIDAAVATTIERLESRAMLVAAGVIVMRHATSGRRTRLAVALSGCLARKMIREHGQAHPGRWLAFYDQFIEKCFGLAGDQEVHTRCMPSGEYNKLRENPEARVQGLPSLREVVGEDNATLINGWMGLEPPPNPATAEFERFNSSNAVIKVGDKTFILTETPRSKRESYSLMGMMSAQAWYANLPPVRVGRRSVPFLKAWMEWPGRRQYPDGLVFHPNEVVETAYNTWRGWPIKPRHGDCQLYLDHVHKVIAAGDQRHGDWILAWMADAVQNPAKRTGTAIALRGGQGTGKGQFVHYFGRLFGRAFLHLTDAHSLTGNFNSMLEGRMLAFADEAIWGGDKRAEGRLKAMVTERTIKIEHKGVNSYEQDNFLRLILATNHEWVAPAGDGERRFAIFDVADTHCQDREYFRAIDEQMNNGGLEALMDFLLRFDLKEYAEKGIRPSIIPKTKALSEVKLITFDSKEQWLYGRLFDGEFDIPAHGGDVPAWGSKCLVKVMQNDFKNWARSINARVEKNYEWSLGALLVKIGITKIDYFPRRYVLPSLATARDLFEKNVLKGQASWDDGEPDRYSNPSEEMPF